MTFSASRHLHILSGLGLTMLATVASHPVLADWKSETGTFRIGIVARADRGGVSVDYSPAAKAISTAIGMPVEIVPMIDYPTLIEAQSASRIEYAVYSATAFATAVSLCKCVVPLAAPVTEKGDRATVAIAVSSNEEIKSLDDVALGKLAWPKGEGSPATFIRGDFLVAGKPVTGDERFIRPVDTPEAAITALKKGKADTLVGWAYAQPDGKPRQGTGTLAAIAGDKIEASVIWVSRPLRFGPHAVRKDVPADIRTALTNFLVSDVPKAPEVAELLDESFHGRFESVAETDYADVIEEAENLRARPAK